MINGVILATKSTWRSRLDLDYLDEISERKRRASRESASVSSEGAATLKHFTDYASKETLGQVHAGGFLHNMIRMNPDGTSTAPSQLSNEERKRRISQAWFSHFHKFPSSSKKPVIKHRLVFSMSTPMHDALVEAGLNPDQVLQSTMKKVMEKFRERFHPTDSIGYAYGIHHDTDNLHVHVALCPRTAKGAYVGCSMSRSKTGGHKNQMLYLRRCFERENERWAEILSSPQKLEETISKRLDSDKMVFSPKLRQHRISKLRKTQSAEAQNLQKIYENIGTLEKSIAAKRSLLAIERNTFFVSQLMGRRRSKAERIATKVRRTVERNTLRELQQMLFRIKREYRALHRRYLIEYGLMPEAGQSASKPNTQTISHYDRRESIRNANRNASRHAYGVDGDREHRGQRID
jgi:hypothetical protein